MMNIEQGMLNFEVGNLNFIIRYHCCPGKIFTSLCETLYL